MTPGRTKGRAAKRPNKQGKDKKGPSGKSGWVKPDGTPLRKRKGDYFPDREIEKRTPAFRKKREDLNRADKPVRESKPDTWKKPESEQGESRPFKPGRETRPAFSRERKPDLDKPAGRGDRSVPGADSRPFRKEKNGKPAFSRDRNPSFGNRIDRVERPADKASSENDRAESRPFRTTWPGKTAFSRDRKPAFGKRNSRDGKPFFGDRFRKDRKDAGPHRERKSQKSDSSSATGAVRLNKYIANAGICSRREADDLITAGVISINGEIVTELGTKVMPGDEVKFHEQTLRTEKPVYVLLNKPKDFITTTDDPQERKTVMNLVHDACKERILPVGRLDRNTTGLLLFTNDGDLTKKLTHPSGNITKIYTVELDRNITRDDMQRALDGIELEDGIAALDAIEYDVSGEKNIVGVELHSGRNRVVRRIFEAMDYKVKKLDRVMFAGLTKKDLPRGRWRFLTEMEVNSLKMITRKKR